MASAKEYTTERIRNVAVLGHGGSGKTALIDALSFVSGTSKKHSDPAEGGALTMHTPEEVSHGISIQLTPAYAETLDTKVNLLDTPGYLDFTGETISAVRVADGALIVVGAVLGHLYNRWADRQANPGFAERMGVLTATGFIVGDSLFNVVYAALVAGSDDVDVLAITEATGWQTPAGVLLFAAIIVLLYGWTRSQASQALSAADAPPPTQAAPR